MKDEERKNRKRERQKKKKRVMGERKKECGFNNKVRKKGFKKGKKERE